MLTDIENIENRLFGRFVKKHLRRGHVDIFNTYYLENQSKNEEINCLIAAYKWERNQFIESTGVLEFQEAVSSTAEFAVPEEKECINIEVSRNWAKVNTLKDVMSLAQRVFGDKYKSFSSFNVVPRMESIFITWLFPKRLKANLQELVSTRRAVFRQEDVRKVKVGDITAFTCVSSCEKYTIKLRPSLFLLKPTIEPDEMVSFNQCSGSFIACSSTSPTSLPPYSPPSLTVEDLVKVCKNVDDWYNLGLHLRLSVKQLDHICRNYSHLGTEAMKRMMFDVWLKSTPGASRTDLITALREIGEDYVACMHKESDLMKEEKLRRCTVLNTIGSCQKIICSVEICRLSHGVLRVVYHYKWLFKDDLQVVSEKEKSKLRQLYTEFYQQLVEAVSDPDTCHSLTTQLHSTSLLSEEKKAVVSSSVVRILVQLEADIERPNSEKADLLHCIEEEFKTADECMMTAVHRRDTDVEEREERISCIKKLSSQIAYLTHQLKESNDKINELKAQYKSSLHGPTLSLLTAFFLQQKTYFALKTVNLQKCQHVICLTGKGEFGTILVPVHRGHLIAIKVPNCDCVLQLLRTNNNLRTIEYIITEKLSKKTFHRTCEYGQMNLTHYLITEQNICNSQSQFSTTVNDHSSLVLAAYLTNSNIEQHSKESVLPLHIACERAQNLFRDFIYWNELSQSRNLSKQLLLLNLSNALKSSGTTELQSDPKLDFTKHEDASQSAFSVQQNVTKPCPDQELQSSLKVNSQKSVVVTLPVTFSLYGFSAHIADLQGENTQSKNGGHGMCSGLELIPLDGNTSLEKQCCEQYTSFPLNKQESKYECTETVNRNVTQLKGSLDTTEEYSAEQDNAELYIDDIFPGNLFKNTNKSDLLNAAGRAMLIGAATLIRDMESQFARFTETQSNISGVISAMWSYSMIPTVNSFTNQLAGGGLVQLIC